MIKKIFSLSFIALPISIILLLVSNLIGTLALTGSGPHYGFPLFYYSEGVIGSDYDIIDRPLFLLIDIILIYLIVVVILLSVIKEFNINKKYILLAVILNIVAFSFLLGHIKDYKPMLYYKLIGYSKIITIEGSNNFDRWTREGYIKAENACLVSAPLGYKCSILKLDYMENAFMVVL